MPNPILSTETNARRAQILEGVFDAIRADDLALAKRLAGEALSGGVEHPVLLNLRALESEESGRLEEALADLRRAHFLAPGDHTILNACGLCLARLDRLDEAMRCYERALAIAPDFGPAWFNSGWAQDRTGEKGKAAASYAKAAELNPENAQAWANMAALAALRGDTESARRHAERALAAQPGHPTAVLALADMELAEPRAAERRLRELLATKLGPFDRALALGQLGDALDALDKPAQAFDAYTQSNALFRAQEAPRFEGPGQPTMSGTLRLTRSWAESLDAGRWKTDLPAGGSSAGELGHVFLIGFPRSGTTLIESALAKHPDVVALEERRTLDASVLAFLGDSRALSTLVELSDRDLKFYRDDYWKRVREFGADPRGKVFIDKNPFNTLRMPVINKLFPNAKILFAVRDPRDVVLSCFRRRFHLNPSTFEFLDFRQTAANYDGVMGLADTLRTKMVFDEMPLVYERLVEDFAAVTRSTCEFIGVDWRPDLIDFSGRAHRGDVGSASSAQIARGLYANGAGQWHRYRAQLAPVMSKLAPWVERFGYPEA